MLKTAATKSEQNSTAFAAVALGIVIGLLGLVLFVGGTWLVWIGGSIYYLLAGLGLLASGYYLTRGNSMGAWIYVAVFVLTVPWAIWESDADPWAIVPRLVGPSILLAAVALISPTLLSPKSGRRTATISSSISRLSAMRLATDLSGVFSVIRSIIDNFAGFPKLTRRRHQYVWPRR